MHSLSASFLHTIHPRQNLSTHGNMINVPIHTTNSDKKVLGNMNFVSYDEFQIIVIVLLIENLKFKLIFECLRIKSNPNPNYFGYPSMSHEQIQNLK